MVKTGWWEWSHTLCYFFTPPPFSPIQPVPPHRHDLLFKLVLVITVSEMLITLTSYNMQSINQSINQSFIQSISSLLGWNESVQVYYRLFISAFSVEDQVIKREEGWEGRVRIPLTDLNPPNFSAFPKTKIWISNVICRVLFYVQWFEMVRFVGIGGIVDHHFFKLFFYNRSTTVVEYVHLVGGV